MKKNNKIVILFLSAIVLSFTACIDSNLNIDPNAATEEMMSRDDLKVGSFLTQMQRNVFIVGIDRDGAYQRAQNLAGDIYSGYMGATGAWNGGINPATYHLPYEDWTTTMFDNGYQNIMAPWNEIRKIAKEEFPQKYAVATIIKVVGMHRVTDTYGPIPYTEYGAQAQVPYDSQEKIYDAFFAELTEAADILTDYYTASGGARAIAAEYDFIYQGNVINWIKFANSLRLRLAMRLTYVDLAKAKIQAEAAMNHVHGVMTSPSDIANLNRNSKFVYNHPLYEICYNFKDVKMGATMDAYMNGYQDPRRLVYFNLASDGVYRGVRTGITITEKEKYANVIFSDLNVTTGSTMMWMTPAEVFFLRAEGAMRGWDMKATAQEMYEKGIETSFATLGVNNPAGYYANTTLRPAAYTDPQTGVLQAAPASTLSIAWVNSGTGGSDANKLERIITQKWLAMYPDGQEAWSEFRRTGYPRLFPVVDNHSGGRVNTGTQICRLPYLSNEYLTNNQNVLIGVDLLGGADHAGTKLWWDKN